MGEFGLGLEQGLGLFERLGLEPGSNKKGLGLESTKAGLFPSLAKYSCETMEWP